MLIYFHNALFTFTENLFRAYGNSFPKARKGHVLIIHSHCVSS